ncbi:MAG TPA: hypothetical protein VE954_35750 [Oligoflexus sp.]|uniref:hypothetical protein n=1 Tax=Oligoflexus sp. TaxID=1971216 RepID=UPI002D76286C|nr:hypothetical protein [Oligoflexus sp.]HYX38488.1 hypothetical protein [Oligoflexus sp.]
MRFRTFVLPVLLMTWASGGWAETATAPSGPKFSGYGDLVFSYADYGADPKASSRGSKKDKRLLFDTTRFVLELEQELTRGFSFEAELEIEHGGTGSSLELEYEEAGEYESEVEKGGEIQFEKLFVEKNFALARVRIGRMPVAFGLLPVHHEPFDYLGTVRAESEEHLIPSGWSEIGAEVMLHGFEQKLQVQIVNGLDSTGFSSQYFVSGGQQRMFETNKANNPALVLRWTNSNIPGLNTGFSYYYGDSSANRPQPDLTKTCPGDNDAQEVAPCGYVETTLQMFSWFAYGQWDRIQGQASVVHGKLQNADDINSRNAGLSQKYQGVLRSPVGKEAYSAWTEWGYRFDGFEAEDKIVPFVRWESYDTVYKAAAGALDQPRFARHNVSLGVNYQVASALNFKLDATERKFGSDHLRTEHDYRFALNFVY